MNPLLRLLGAAASHGLLTGQIVFSSAFVGGCELPNWIHAPRQVNACRSRSPALALFFNPVLSHHQARCRGTDFRTDPGPSHLV